MTPIFWRGVAPMLTALVLAACQSTASSPSPAGSSAAPAASIPAKPAASAAKKTAIKTAYSSFTATQAPLFSAKDGGYFDEEGLSADVSLIASGAPMLGAIQGGDVPIVFMSASETIQAGSQGLDVVIIGAFIDQFLNEIWVGPSIQTPDQLKGKTLGVTGIGASSHTSGLLVLERLGLKGQVNFLPTGNPQSTLAAIQNGKIDGAPLVPPAGLQAKKLGLHRLVDPATLNLPSIDGTVETTKKFAREHPDVVEAYLRATIKGTHRLNTDTAFAKQTVGSWLHLEDQEVLDETVSVYQGKWEKDAFPSLPGIKQSLSIAAQTISAAANATPEQFVDTSFVEKIKASGLVNQLYGAS